MTSIGKPTLSGSRTRRLGAISLVASRERMRQEATILPEGKVAVLAKLQSPLAWRRVAWKRLSTWFWHRRARVGLLFRFFFLRQETETRKEASRRRKPFRARCRSSARLGELAYSNGVWENAIWIAHE